MRLAALALLLAVAAAPAAAGSTAPADEAEARRLLEAALLAFDRLPRVEIEHRDGEAAPMHLLREEGVGLEIRAAEGDMLLLGGEAWGRTGADAPWVPRPGPEDAFRAFVEQMDVMGAPITAPWLRERIAEAQTISLLPPSPDPDFVTPAASAEPACRLVAVALDVEPGVSPAEAELELRVCAEDARLVSALVRHRLADGSVRTEHARYIDPGERRLTRP